MENLILNHFAEDIPGMFGVNRERADEMKIEIEKFREEFADAASQEGGMDTIDIINGYAKVARTEGELRLILFMAGKFINYLENHEGVRVIGNIKNNKWKN